MSINQIHEMISNPLTDENLKKIISIMEKDLDDSLYVSLKKSKNVGPLEYETIVKKYF